MAAGGRGKAGRSVALFVAALAAFELVPVVPGLPFYVGQGLARVAATAVVVGFVALLGGARSLAPTAAGVRASLRLGAYPAAVAGVICALELVALLAALRSGDPSASLSPAWLPDLLGVAFLCAFVGLFEEGLCRVLLLGGLLSRYGGTRNGVVASAVASAVVFGAIHVTSSAFSGFDALALAQMLLKTAQAGFVGLLFAGVYVRTRSYCGVALAHGLSDFLLMAPLALVGEEGMLGGYVFELAPLEGPVGGLLAVAAAVMLAFYGMVVALYVPAAVGGWRLLEGADVPQRGPFGPGWEPREVARADEPTGSGDGACGGEGRPTPPAGWRRG